MRICDLIDKTYMKVFGNENLEILGLSDNSKTCKPGYLFFAIDGTKQDGRGFATEAVQNGAVAVLSKTKLDLPNGIVNIVCKDERMAIGDVCASFYGHPSKALFVVSVTGTNGKTTTTFMLEKIFAEAGKKVGIIGTNGAFWRGKQVCTNMTTPDPILFQKLLAKMRDDGVQIVCVEMSAHALELQKNRGVLSDIALFTNLTQDHLDFFKNMQKYYASKAKLFTPENAIIGVVNLDDKKGEKLYKESKIPMLTYSCSGNKNASIKAINVSQKSDCQKFTISILGEQKDIELKMLGGFNIANALASIGAGFIYGLDLETIKRGIEKLEKVDGRFNTYRIGDVLVIIDFAHTPDGLENILRTARQMTTSNVISVFGCGGNRDQIKRPIMGEISEKYATYTFITNDNPRFEEPIEIAKQIQSGMKKDTHQIELSRECAILKAVKMAKSGDVVVISGKGSENYMEINGEKTFYQDKDVVLKIKNSLFANN